MRVGFVLGLNGLAGAGKDSVAKVLVEEYGFLRLAFADAVRDVALAINPYVEPMGNVRLSTYIEMYGWDSAKRDVPEIRRLLQAIGTEAGRQVLGESCWVDIVRKKILDPKNMARNVVITDMRFENEVKLVKAMGGTTVKILRPTLVADATVTAHVSEQLQFQPDYQIINGGTLDDLKLSTDQLVHWLTGVYGKF